MGGSVVALGTLGGTIAMAPTAEVAGVVPRLGAADLLSAVPSLIDVADVRPHDLRRVPGASLTERDLLGALDWATNMVDQAAAGVVLVQGTDTLEETAYLLDLWWDRPEPLVLTGAMRTPDTDGADGPANLVAAVTTAASPRAREHGVLVAMDNTLHAAARVRKSHATALGAFTSPDSGPRGLLHEGAAHLRLGSPPQRHAALPLPSQPTRVALLETHLGDDGELLRHVGDAGYDGVVVAAYGAGHVCEDLADVVQTLVPRLPVVVATRTGAGSTLSDTYGFPGSETDLRARGALLAGWLDPRKARLLTWAVLSGGSTREQLARELADRGKAPA